MFALSMSYKSSAQWESPKDVHKMRFAYMVMVHAIDI